MFKYIIKNVVENNFKSLSKGDYNTLLKTVHDDVEHQFLGTSAIGGNRKSKLRLQKWFERLFRLFPSIVFTIERIIISGWPWKTMVVVQWRALVKPISGSSYTNTGVHIIELVWFKAKKIQAYENAELVKSACDIMIKNGIEEAGDSPIT